jgi:hypothetical protein
MPDIAPAPVLALLVGIFDTGLYLFIRGAAGLRLPFVALASILGALAGQALAVRLGDPLRIGDFGLLWTALLSWIGIILIVAASTMSQSRGGQRP